METNTTESDSSEYKSEHVELQQTLSEQLLTSEQRQLRREYRMAKSEFCLADLWRLYNKLVDADRCPALEPGSEPKLAECSSIDYRRQARLQKKYKYLLDGISLIIQAPERPYLFSNYTRQLDSPGRRLMLPRAIRACRPDVLVTSESPFERAVAETKQWMDVSNLNFQVVSTRYTASTQTNVVEIEATPCLYKPSLSGLSQPELQVDLDNLPLDKEGNPVGKRTGFCEWCGKDILPIPTADVLSKTWDRRSLYCCREYRTLVEDSVRFEKQILDAKNEAELLLDTIHKKKHIPTPAMDADEDSSNVGNERSKSYLVKRGSIFNKALMLALEERKVLLEEKTIGVEGFTDTLDLPWDPYVTRFRKSRTFSESVFDYANEHQYPHADIVLNQAELYTKTSMEIRRIDL